MFEGFKGFFPNRHKVNLLLVDHDQSSDIEEYRDECHYKYYENIENRQNCHFSQQLFLLLQRWVFLQFSYIKSDCLFYLQCCKVIDNWKEQEECKQLYVPDCEGPI